MYFQDFPDVSGTNVSATENDTSVGLQCVASGIPSIYTFNNWEHIAPDGVTLLRNLPSNPDGTLVFPSVDYQDTGHYKCSVSNGVTDFITGKTTANTNIALFVKSKIISI